MASIKKIYPNDFLKVFIHTWKISSDEQYILDSFSGTKTNGSFGTVDLNILSEYNAENILIENYNIKRKKFIALRESFGEVSGRTDIGIISMYYSIFKSNELKRKYERKNKILFDKVIRMRFDSDFCDKELILDPDINSIQVPLGKDWAGMNDQFALGPSKQMDVYSNLYNKMYMVQIACGDHNPELLMRTHLGQNQSNISVQRFDFQVCINGNESSTDPS